MLEFLHLENVAVAKDIDIHIGEGFNVLTGETGAGKSIIIDSISLLTGTKASKEIVRHGEERAVISALFSNVNQKVYDLCDEYGIPYDKDDLFSITRTIFSDGKGIIKINSKAVSLMQLKLIGSSLINIHGQNDNFTFMNKANHIYMLDEYIGIDDLLIDYEKEYKELQSIKNNITSLFEQLKQKNLMIDALRFQIKEIESAKLKDDEEEEKLIEKRNKLKSSELILKSTNIAYKALYKSESGISATFLIDKAIESLKKIEQFDSEITELIDKLLNTQSEIEDVAERVKEISEIDVDNPTKQLDAIEERLSLIQRLKNKYAPTVKEILVIKQEAENKLDEFENGEIKLDKLKEEYKIAYQKCCAIADKIHQKRTSGAVLLSESVKNSLMFLDMPKVQFEIKVEKNIKNEKVVLSTLGYDDVEFTIATNVGEKLTSMDKIASGGELSRIMLALKSAINDKNGPQTAVFDEIDTGLSGSTSQKIGYKLVKISEYTQVVCVTHSAQIAAFANNHYLIKKIENDGRAETRIKLLNKEESIDEIARIIGGTTLTQNQHTAAKELIDESNRMLS